ncbi:hypothetical protein HHI36_004118 [Cryptolaemus montrouzieri]|uniref:Uncharacterized protein n=1 Tax=Cryptolaemus montrouzieri TaxID=559131 RepID=A0ABD2NQ95_9CUCU
MKRSSTNAEDTSEIPNKVFLVNRENDNLTAFNPGQITRHESLLLKEHNSKMNQFLELKTLNKIDMIGRQMKNLQDMMSEVLSEAELHNELNKAACNFVKRPGHIYHLYERFSGNKYFSMLSPEEWQNAPHKYIGSWRLQADYSWTDPRKESTLYEGIKFLKEFGSFNIPTISNPAIQYNY